MNNFTIYTFYQTIIKDINNSRLPIGTAYFILKSILIELEQGFKEAALQQQKQNQNTEEKFFTKINSENSNEENLLYSLNKNQDQSQD